MLEQVEKIIDDFYATNSSEIEMSFYNLLEQLNLQDTDKDKNYSMMHFVNYKSAVK